MHLGIDVGFSERVRSTGVCVIDAHASEPVRALHVRKSDVFEAIDKLVGPRQPLAISIDGPLCPGTAEKFEVVNRYRQCERRLSGGIFQKRCKPGPTNSPRGFALHQQATKIANHLRVKYPKTLIAEAFPNAFLGVMLPDSSFVSPIRRGTKSDVFWEHCLKGAFMRRLSHLLYRRHALRIMDHASVLDNHDERAAFVCAITARGAEAQMNFVVGGGQDGSIALPPASLIQPWARKALRAAVDTYEHE